MRRVLVVRSLLVGGDGALLLMRVVSDCKRCARSASGAPPAGMLVRQHASSGIQKADVLRVRAGFLRGAYSWEQILPAQRQT